MYHVTDKLQKYIGEFQKKKYLQEELFVAFFEKLIEDFHVELIKTLYLLTMDTWSESVRVTHEKYLKGVT